jgi:tripartite-type tricarboxylate transporter receptor subunit TctC
MKKLLLAATAVFLSFAPVADAQEFPSRTVTMVVPFPAGAGANDTNGRFLADKLSKLWGQPVIVENRPGGNTSIGAMVVVRSEPDGHTIMFSSGGYTMQPAVTPLPFDAATDLKPAAMFGIGEYLLVTGPHNDVKDAKDFIELAKQREVGREMIYSGGTAGADLGSVMFMKAAGIEMLRVPYKGTNDALIDLLGGRLDFLVAAVGSQVGNVREGRVRALAVTGPTRSPLLPEVPTLRELGLGAAELPTWWMVFVPKDTPDAVVVKINESVDTVLASEETKTFLASQSVVGKNMKPAELSEIITAELARFKQLAEANGLVEQ